MIKCIHMNMLTLILCAIPVITNVNGLVNAVEKSHAGQTFDLCARITQPKTQTYPFLIFEDDSAAYYTFSSFSKMEDVDPHPGDYVRIQGRINARDDDYGIHSCNADCLSLEILHRGSASSPIKTTPATLFTGKYDYCSVCLTGMLQDSKSQRNSKDWYDLTLNCEGDTIYLFLHSYDNLSKELEALIGAKVEAVGICHPQQGSMRRLTGRVVLLPSFNQLRVIDPPKDRFDAPFLDTSLVRTPLEISRLGRVKIQGKVIAVWDNRLLLQLPNADTVSVEMTSSIRPSYGSFIETVGFVETDTYYFHLTRAIWRSHQPFSTQQNTASSLRTIDITKKGISNLDINSRCQGVTMTLTGSVAAAAPDGKIDIENNGQIFHINASASLDGVHVPQVGSRLCVTGICVIDVEKWQPHSPFPDVTGFSIIPRSASDILVLNSPPWWTPRRLMILVITLVACLVGALTWVRVLQKLVERRSRALFREELGHAKAALRVDERTHLAVELHDALSQTLTGVALQVDAAERARQKAPDRLAGHLATARRTLESCREELRNCLWDLRNQALEINDVNRAIQETLEPHIGTATLSVRFALARSRLSDSTMYAVLRIVRELAVNAVRHGHASAIRVAGSIENGRLLFSVRDDGCGFDPEKRSGIDTGHFGLHGIGERVAALDGSVSITSSIGKGTKVTVSLNLMNLSPAS